jgi:hypothetical protein
VENISTAVDLSSCFTTAISSYFVMRYEVGLLNFRKDEISGAMLVGATGGIAKK